MRSIDEKAIPDADCGGGRQGTPRSMIFFDRKQLRQLGIVIRHGKPLTDPSRMGRRLAQLGFSLTACAVPATYFSVKSRTAAAWATEFSKYYSKIIKPGIGCTYIFILLRCKKSIDAKSVSDPVRAHDFHRYTTVLRHSAASIRIGPNRGILAYLSVLT